MKTTLAPGESPKNSIPHTNLDHRAMHAAHRAKRHDLGSSGVPGSDPAREKRAAEGKG